MTTTDDSGVDYRLLLWKYMMTIVSKDLLEADVCPGCLDSPEMFTEKEIEAIHAIGMMDEPPGRTN